MGNTVDVKKMADTFSTKCFGPQRNQVALVGLHGYKHSVLVYNFYFQSKQSRIINPVQISEILRVSLELCRNESAARSICVALFEIYFRFADLLEDVALQGPNRSRYLDLLYLDTHCGGVFLKQTILASECLAVLVELAR